MKLPMKEKTGYGIGAFGTEMISTTIAPYLILFETSKERMEPFAKKTSIKDGFKSFKGSKPGFALMQSVQPEGAVHGIYLMNGFIPVIFSAIAILAVVFLYNLTNKKTAEIYAELEVRRNCKS